MTSRRATMADVARRAGVSKTSVSRVLNGKGELNPETVDRIRQAMKDLGYVPAATARSLAKGRAGSIGLLVPSGAWWSWTLQIIHGVVEAVEKAGYTATLTVTDSDEAAQEELAQRIIKARAIDGLVAVLPPAMLGFLAQIDQEGMPVVLVDEGEHRPPFASVRADNLGGAREAAGYLARTVAGKIGFISGPLDEYPVHNRRLLGYQRGLEEAGIPFDDGLVRNAGLDSQSGELAAESLLASHPDLRGLFCAADYLAVGAMRVLRRSGRSTPDDVSVIGFDDAELAREFDPPLTTVRQPLVEMGSAAANMVLGLLDGQEQPHEIVLPTSLVVRETTGASG